MIFLVLLITLHVASAVVDEGTDLIMLSADDPRLLARHAAATAAAERRRNVAETS